MGRAGRHPRKLRRRAVQRSEGPTGSLEQDSLSLRHLAANPYTVEGGLERISIEAEMAQGEGWRAKTLRVWLIVSLGLPALFLIGFYLIRLLRWLF